MDDGGGRLKSRFAFCDSFVAFLRSRSLLYSLLSRWSLRPPVRSSLLKVCGGDRHACGGSRNDDDRESMLLSI